MSSECGLSKANKGRLRGNKRHVSRSKQASQLFCAQTACARCFGVTLQEPYTKLSSKFQRGFPIIGECFQPDLWRRPNNEQPLSACNHHQLPFSGMVALRVKVSLLKATQQSASLFDSSAGDFDLSNPTPVDRLEGGKDCERAYLRILEEPVMSALFDSTPQAAS